MPYTLVALCQYQKQGGAEHSREDRKRGIRQQQVNFKRQYSTKGHSKSSSVDYIKKSAFEYRPSHANASRLQPNYLARTLLKQHTEAIEHSFEFHLASFVKSVLGLKL